MTKGKKQAASLTHRVQAHLNLKDAIQKNYLLLIGFPEYIASKP